MNGPVHPPCWKPPSVSSPACPGPWITPSSEVYSITAILLIVRLLQSFIHPAPARGIHQATSPDVIGPGPVTNRQRAALAPMLVARRPAWTGPLHQPR